MDFSSRPIDTLSNHVAGICTRSLSGKSAALLLSGLLIPSGLAAAEPNAKSAPDSKSVVEKKRTDIHGDPLPDGAVARLGTGRFRHSDHIYSLAFSPDGKQIASAGVDRAIRLWDCATGREVRRFLGHKNTINFVTFAHDGRELLSASADQSIRLWDIRTGKEIRRLVDHGNGHGKDAVALSPDGKTLAFGEGTEIRLLSVADAKVIGNISLPSPNVALLSGINLAKQIRFSPDGKRLGALVESAGVFVFDAANCKLLWKNEEHPSDAHSSMSGVAFSPDGKTVAATPSWRKPLRLFDAETGKVIRTFEGSKAAGSLIFSDDGKRIFSSGWERSSLIWDVATGKTGGEFSPAPPYYHTASLSPDGRTLALAAQRSIVFYDTATCHLVNTPEGAHEPINFLRFSTDGREVFAGAYCDHESGLRRWDLANGRQLFASKPASITALAPDGQTFASSFRDSEPEIAVTATGTLLRKTNGKLRFLDTLTYSPDGQLLVGMGDRTINLWDVSTGEDLKPLGQLPNIHGAKCLAAAPTGNLIVSGGVDKIVRLWDVSARKEVGELIGMKGAVTGFGWAPDGEELAAVSSETSPGDRITDEPDPHVRIWDVASRKERLKLEGSRAGNWCVAWSIDGRLVAAGGNDHIVRVWERATGQERFRLAGHEGPITALAFNPDGRRLVSGCSDTTILVWDVEAPGSKPHSTKADDLASLWQMLGAEASTADRAIRLLLAWPEASVRMIGERLPPAAKLDADRVARLIADLDDERFATREMASKELEGLGKSTATTLRKVLNANPNAEVRKRIEALLAKFDEFPSGARLRALRAIEVLERLGTPEARNLLRKLAEGAAEERMTRDARAALERLARAKKVGERP